MDAFRAEMIGLLPRLRRFALGLTLDAFRADDLVQAGCERALANQHQWQPGTRLDSWMFRILRNLWIDQLRAQPQAADLQPEEFESLPDQDWDRRTEAQLTLEQVLQCMERLPDDMRAILMLVCVEGASYKDASATLGIPIGTVMSRLARARIALHKSFGNLHPDAGEHHAHLH